MSGPESDPFEQMFNPELASDEDLRIMEHFVTELVEDAPTETNKGFVYEVEATGAALELRTVYFEEHDATEPAVMLKLGRDEAEDWNFTLLFNHKNELSSLNYFEDDDLTEARLVCDELLDEPDVLDAEMIGVVRHLRDVVDYASGKKLIEQTTSLSTLSSGTHQHIADVTRRTINEKVGNRAMIVREYKKDTPEGRLLQIRTSELVGFSPEEMGLQTVPLVELVVHDRASGVVHYYKRTSYGSSYVAVNDQQQDFIHSEPDEELSGLFPEFFEQLHPAMPEKAAIELFTQTMIDATLPDMLEGSGEVAKEASIWADLQLYFHFDAERFLECGEVTVNKVACEALRSMQHVNEYVIAHKFPEKAAYLPDYTYRESREERVNKFLRERVASVHGDKDSRANIVDIHLACQDILDELAEENHPVTQMIAQLYLDYGDLVGDVIIQQVVTTVIKQTQEKRLRNYYKKRNNAWRAGSLVVV